MSTYRKESKWREYVVFMLTVISFSTLMTLAVTRCNSEFKNRYDSEQKQQQERSNDR